MEKKIVVKASEGKHRNFKGVDFSVLSYSNNSMVTKMLYKENDNVPFHNHINEQSGYVISGKYLLKFLDKSETIEEGDSYTIPSNVEHSLEVIIPGIVIDFFSPKRDDYL
jgi:quercetin dioxygenase-like cupin family protein